MQTQQQNPKPKQQPEPLPRPPLATDDELALALIIWDRERHAEKIRMGLVKA